MKKIILFITLFACATMVNAQDYLDILKVSHSQASLGNVVDSLETDVSNTNIELYMPIPITQKAVILAGFTYENTGLGNMYFNFDEPQYDFVDGSKSLIMTRLNLGVKINHGNRWSGTYVALPKLASDFSNLGSDDFQMGGLALLEKKYSGRKVLKFGAFRSTTTIVKNHPNKKRKNELEKKIDNKPITNTTVLLPIIQNIFCTTNLKKTVKCIHIPTRYLPTI